MAAAARRPRPCAGREARTAQAGSGSQSAHARIPPAAACLELGDHAPPLGPALLDLRRGEPAFADAFLEHVRVLPFPAAVDGSQMSSSRSWVSKPIAVRRNGSWRFTYQPVNRAPARARRPRSHTPRPAAGASARRGPATPSARATDAARSASASRPRKVERRSFGDVRREQSGSSRTTTTGTRARLARRSAPRGARSHRPSTTCPRTTIGASVSAVCGECSRCCSVVRDAGDAVRYAPSPRDRPVRLDDRHDARFILDSGIGLTIVLGVVRGAGGSRGADRGRSPGSACPGRRSSCRSRGRRRCSSTSFGGRTSRSVCST